jgi:hypothetical protein
MDLTDLTDLWLDQKQGSELRKNIIAYFLGTVKQGHSGHFKFELNNNNFSTILIEKSKV